MFIRCSFNNLSKYIAKSLCLEIHIVSVPSTILPSTQRIPYASILEGLTVALCLSNRDIYVVFIA